MSIAATYVDPYVAFGTEPMREPAYAGPDAAARKAMIGLGFVKVRHHIVYTGRVPMLVAWLLENGWRPAAHRNPYLLEHPEAGWMFNYAESETRASDRYVSFFPSR